MGPPRHDGGGPPYPIYTSQRGIPENAEEAAVPSAQQKGLVEMPEYVVVPIGTVGALVQHRETGRMARVTKDPTALYEWWAHANSSAYGSPPAPDLIEVCYFDDRSTEQVSMMDFNEVPVMVPKVHGIE